MSRNQMIIAGSAVLLVVVIVVYWVMYAKDKFDNTFHFSTELFHKIPHLSMKEPIAEFISKNPDWNYVDHSMGEVEATYKFTENMDALRDYGTSLYREVEQKGISTSSPIANEIVERAIFPKVMRQAADRIYTAVNGKTGVWIAIPVSYLGADSLGGLIPAVKMFRCKRNKERIMLYNVEKKQLVSVNNAVYEDVNSYLFLTK